MRKLVAKENSDPTMFNAGRRILYGIAIAALFVIVPIGAVLGSGHAASPPPIIAASPIAEPTPDDSRLQAIADQVRKRHLGEWVKIPHVVGAGLILSGKTVAIDIEVDEPDNVRAVARVMPHAVDGIAIVVLPIWTAVLY